MEKFTDNINKKQNHYSNDQILHNKLYNLIEETLSPKLNGKDSNKISLIGKETLVTELEKIVTNEILKTENKILESFKQTGIIYG
jgi:hypothetical protein